MGYTKKHIIAIISGLFIVLISGLLSKTYRPYIYSHHISDFHFADTITNWACVPVASLFFWGIYKEKYSFTKCIIYSVISFVVFEFIFTLTFDWYDIIATILSGCVTFLIYLAYKYFQSKKS